MSVVSLMKCHVVLSFSVLLLACSSVPLEEVSRPFDKEIRDGSLLAGGMKIGLLADSRFQTPQSMHGAALTAKQRQDFIINEELRPPALGRLTPDLLEYYLKRLVDEEGVDMILYLGNAANNGCRDEVEFAFEILTKYRDGLYDRVGKSVPIFFVIGNHDYLGAGYTPHMPDRNIFCYDKAVAADSDLNNPLDKYELIARVHEFNSGNFGPINQRVLTGWRYEDNYDQQDLQTACIVRDKGRYQHVKRGCYLAGKLSYQDGSEILLVDSSDFYDERNVAELTQATKKWYGLTGWVSTADGAEGVTASCDQADGVVPLQAQWFECRQSRRPPPVRIIASHFPLKSLSMIGRPVVATADVMCHLSALFNPRPVMGNYWLAADTHLPPYLITDRVNSGPCVRAGAGIAAMSLNIGSTVDYDQSLAKRRATRYENMTDMSTAVDYEPGAVVMGVARDGDGAKLLARQIRVDVRSCGAVINELRAQPQPDSPVYMPVRGKTDYRKLFGLDTEYKNLQWTEYDQINSIQNLDKFIDHLVVKFGDAEDLDEDKIKACIALESARFAGELQTRSFECESCPPWRIMRQIEEETSAHY